MAAATGSGPVGGGGSVAVGDGVRAAIGVRVAVGGEPDPPVAVGVAWGDRAHVGAALDAVGRDRLAPSEVERATVEGGLKALRFQRYR